MWCLSNISEDVTKVGGISISMVKMETVYENFHFPTHFLLNIALNLDEKGNLVRKKSYHCKMSQ